MDIETGLYLARSDAKIQWWNLVLEVTGTQPFFRVKAWNRLDVCLQQIKFPEDLIWGPKIDTLPVKF